MQFANMKEEIKYLMLRYELNQKLESLVYQKGYIKVEPDYFDPYDRFVNMNKRINKNDLVKLSNNDGILAASVFHYGDIKINTLKKELSLLKIPMRYNKEKKYEPNI